MNVTPFEPEWEGFVTLEISNTTPLAGEGVCERGAMPDIVLPVRRGVRGELRGQEGQVSEPDGNCFTETVTS